MRTDIIDNLKLEIDNFISSEDLKREVRDQVADAFKILITDKEKKKTDDIDKKEDTDKKIERKESKSQDSKTNINIKQEDILKFETINNPTKVKSLQRPKQVNAVQKDIIKIRKIKSKKTRN